MKEEIKKIKKSLYGLIQKIEFKYADKKIEIKYPIKEDLCVYFHTRDTDRFLVTEIQIRKYDILLECVYQGDDNYQAMIKDSEDIDAITHEELYADQEYSIDDCFTDDLLKVLEYITFNTDKMEDL